MSMRRFTSSGDTPTANEHRPRPRLPTWRWPSSLVVAPQSGGGGLLVGVGGAPPLRHRPVLPLELVLVVGPAADDVADGLLPHLARLMGVDAEALELGPRRRPARPHVDPAVGDEVEDGDGLGGAHRVVIR